MQAFSCLSTDISEHIPVSYLRRRYSDLSIDIQISCGGLSLAQRIYFASQPWNIFPACFSLCNFIYLLFTYQQKPHIRNISLLAPILSLFYKSAIRTLNKIKKYMVYIKNFIYIYIQIFLFTHMFIKHTRITICIKHMYNI